MSFKLDDKELYILSYYRAGELAGSLLFGKLAFHTEIDAYRIPLTQHCLEEAEHAWLWTKAIKELGGVPQKVTKTYQSEYGKRLGVPKDIIELFCLTQVLEVRVLDHFQKHLDLPSTHPVIKKALKKMIDDETGHIGWIRSELDKYAEREGTTYDDVMARYRQIDEAAFADLAAQEPFKTYFKELL